MPQDRYIVISASEGGLHIKELSKAQIEKNLAEEYWGSDVNIATRMPTESDPNYWGTQLIIIKGEIVVPAKKEVVTKYEL
jgi:hypothetical protein